MSAQVQQKKKPLLSHKSSSDAKGVQLEKPAGVGKIMKKLDAEIKKSKDGKLPVAFKEKWLKALRSGKYKQVTGTLAEEIRTSSKEEKKPKWGYCVLGVAAHVAGYPSDELENEGNIPHDYKKVPALLREPENGNKENELAAKLIEMNDDDGLSFKKLATWIEKNL